MGPLLPLFHTEITLSSNSFYAFSFHTFGPFEKFLCVLMETKGGDMGMVFFHTETLIGLS